jgi:hypothetical protein
VGLEVRCEREVRRDVRCDTILPPCHNSGLRIFNSYVGVIQNKIVFGTLVRILARTNLAVASLDISCLLSPGPNGSPIPLSPSTQSTLLLSPCFLIHQLLVDCCIPYQFVALGPRLHIVGFCPSNKNGGIPPNQQ